MRVVMKKTLLSNSYTVWHVSILLFIVVAQEYKPISLMFTALFNTLLTLSNSTQHVWSTVFKVFQMSILTLWINLKGKKAQQRLW